MKRAAACWIGAFALLPALGGCSASFRAGRLGPVGTWPVGPPADATRLSSVGLAFEGVALKEGGEEALPPAARIVLGNAAYVAYVKAGRFTHVRPASELADLKVGVRLTRKHERSPAALRGAHALTFGLVPSWERDEWTLVTTVSDPQGKPLGRFELSEAVNTWSQLLLFPAFFLAPPPGVAADCVFDLSRATICQAVAQGVF